MKVTNELVQIFWEGHEAVGVLHMNGSTKFYRISPAQKEFVENLLGVDQETEDVIKKV
jgi:hypothetical protein